MYRLRMKYAYEYLALRVCFRKTIDIIKCTTVNIVMCKTVDIIKCITASIVKWKTVDIIKCNLIL